MRDVYKATCPFGRFHLLGFMLNTTIFKIVVNHKKTILKSVLQVGWILKTLESVYSGVVSIRELLIFLFLDELNELDNCATYIGNYYLEEYTKEKIYFIERK